MGHSVISLLNSSNSLFDICITILVSELNVPTIFFQLLPMGKLVDDSFTLLVKSIEY